MSSSASSTEAGEVRQGLMAKLAIPWVDKTIAILASLPFAVELYRRWVGGHVNFPRAVLGVQLLVLILLMVLRTAPLRVTTNPWFWLLAFVTSYGPLAFTTFAGQGISLVPPIVSNGLAVLSATGAIYALLSLGRSIGFIPAQRTIVTKGAYRFVRHPIYTVTFVGFLAFVLRGYSPFTLTLAAALIVLLMVRSVVEEHFLRDDPGYATYMKEVRWRWFPGIA